jgi:hypothetical protein
MAVQLSHLRRTDVLQNLKVYNLQIAGQNYVKPVDPAVPTIPTSTIANSGTVAYWQTVGDVSYHEVEIVMNPFAGNNGWMELGAGGRIVEQIWSDRILMNQHVEFLGGTTSGQLQAGKVILGGGGTFTVINPLVKPASVITATYASNPGAGGPVWINQGTTGQFTINGAANATVNYFIPKYTNLTTAPIS